MLYRVALGMGLQMFQQLTGANYFFYYGTTIFVGMLIHSQIALSTFTYSLFRHGH